MSGSKDDDVDRAPEVSEENESWLRALARAPVVDAPRPWLSGLAEGTRLAQGRFTVVRKLGEGGMGVVYAALDSERETEVALKTLRQFDAGSLYRFKSEFRSLADVRHPHLVDLHGLFAEGDLWFFTMELVHGVPFHRWIRSGAGPFDEARLRAALAQLSAGVDAIHTSGKLHCDLKPSNVLVTRTGRVVILDFGLTVDTALGAVDQTVPSAAISGTPGYMAPEQAAGRRATEASDWYAVGVILFEAVTGRLPFEGSSREVMHEKQHVPCPRASTVESRVPADLDELITGLCARDPAQRLRSTAVSSVLAPCYDDGRDAAQTPSAAPYTDADRSRRRAAHPACRLCGRPAR